MTELPEEKYASLLELGGVALDFATIKRATKLKDGVTSESDTDHTVMVGLLACALASESGDRFDIGKIAQFALVHDLVETYAGDTDTFGGLNEERKLDKEQREALAFERIQKEFDATFPWISKTIAEYESLESPEARFVKTLDKTTPKITRYFNNMAGQTSEEEFTSHCTAQFANLEATYGKDQPEAMGFYAYNYKKVLEVIRAKFKKES